MMKIKPAGSNMTEVEGSDGTSVLFSYKTPVAGFIPGIGFIKTEDFFSVTTSKHIGKWISKNGGKSAEATQVPQQTIEELVLTIAHEN
jgi:hypothetical protein